MSEKQPPEHSSGGVRAEPSKQAKKVKVTLYITEEQNIRIEETKLKLTKRGDKVDRSEIVQRALDLYFSQEE